MVNRPELAERAKELGYDNVFIWSEGIKPEEVADWLEENDKGLAIYLFCEEGDTAIPHSIEIKKMVEGRGRAASIENMIDPTVSEYDLYGLCTEAVTIEDAVKWFPTIEDLRERLIWRGVIKETDYNDRCGNCHEQMDPDDKFCKHCGTKRGEGSFEPYWNVPTVAYGPATKKKYKCRNCGNIWIDLIMNPKTRFCPACGKPDISLLKEREAWLFDIIGTKEPYDEDKHPILLSKEQVLKLLEDRHENKDLDKFSSDYEERLSTIAREIGIDLPEAGSSFNHDLTELQGEQLVMIDNIIVCKGVTTERPKVVCPECQSDLTTVIEYDGKDYWGHSVEKETLQISKRDLEDRVGPLIARYGHETPAFLCLCCGKSFG